MGMALQDILEREETLLKLNDMTNEAKADELSRRGFKDFSNPYTRVTVAHIKNCCLEIAQWKDEQLEHTRNDAKDLYNEISACIGNLVKGRLDKNGIIESNALAQMESLMVKTEQFLLTI